MSNFNMNSLGLWWYFTKYLHIFDVRTICLMIICANYFSLHLLLVFFGVWYSFCIFFWETLEYATVDFYTFFVSLQFVICTSAFIRRYYCQAVMLCIILVKCLDICELLLKVLGSAFQPLLVIIEHVVCFDIFLTHVFELKCLPVCCTLFLHTFALALVDT